MISLLDNAEVKNRRVSDFLVSDVLFFCSEISYKQTDSVFPAIHVAYVCRNDDIGFIPLDV